MNYYPFNDESTSSISSEKYSAVTIRLANPDDIRRWSHGEVTNPETVNYRSLKPEKDGLFCERIFGPTKDWECACGKYKRQKHRGVICDRCGVEVTLSRVRRERMGHIELAVPVSHIWFFKGQPSRIGQMLDIPATKLEKVLYYEDYIVTDSGDTPLQYLQILDQETYDESRDKYGDSFKAGMGAEAILECLKKIDLDVLMAELEAEIASTNSKQKRAIIAKRMKVCEGFRSANLRPEWMILTVLPVIPPDLRPLISLDGGRFASADLNELYRRVINRNNRLKNLKQQNTPEVILRNEKRMLQEAVDAVFDNGRHGHAVQGQGGRDLKSLADLLNGKTGRFRQNLLGKRVDYSGRSVIVVGPSLKLYQCGLPKRMGLTLFEPFVIRYLMEHNMVTSIKNAKKMVERETDEVWEALDYVIKGKTVMLNRAPTLHRLSIQSFEPVLIEGLAIRLHPMVCTAFNADFDGDQMAVHVPLSVEAQMESKLLMLSSNSIFSPASGKSIMTPTQDIVLGIYYLTAVGQRDKLAGHDVGNDPINPDDHLPLFANIAEVYMARDNGAVDNHSRIIIKNPDYNRDTVVGNKKQKYIETTVGRMIFNSIWPSELGYVNRKVDKSYLGKLILMCHKVAGHKRTVEALDDLKDLGYAYACIAGVSMGIKDMIRPPVKAKIITHAHEEVKKIQKNFDSGVMSDAERYNKIVDVWTDASKNVATELYKAIEKNQTEENPNPREMNPLFMMVDSKARGSQEQVRQLAGMRGLMADTTNRVIERPIIACFRDGLSILEYFISSHGARKGLSDTALKTADAGYLTRKLVDVAQDVIVTIDDCGTISGIEVRKSEGENAVDVSERVLGRTALRDIVDPTDPNRIILHADEEITEDVCKEIKAAGIESVWIRSGLTCEAKHGMCAKCYGRDLATGTRVAVGAAVGIIAAQSIGEPGTQLTMRTFHVGGTASTKVIRPEIIAKEAGIVAFEDDVRTVTNTDGKEVVLNKNGSLVIYKDNGENTNLIGRKELQRITLEIGTVLDVAEDDHVTAGQEIAKWDPHAVPIISEYEGTIRFDEFIEGETIETREDATKGISTIVAIEPRSEAHPSITILGIDPSAPDDGVVALGTYQVPVEANVMVADGEKVHPGQIIAKTARQAEKAQDITGGLPRVTELFEARRPKDEAVIATIDGVVSNGQNIRGNRVIIIQDQITGDTQEHHIKSGKHVLVQPGDVVKKGQPLTSGNIVPEQLLSACGPQRLQEYLVNEVQQVYRAQGVEINDKHIEIIVRQMLRKVKITNPGDTDFVWGEDVTRQTFNRINDELREEGRRVAESEHILLGISKAALQTDSFISAASFQQTTQILTDASTLGKSDELRGFKENVILGRRIPGGTGFPIYKHINLVHTRDPLPPEEIGLSASELHAQEIAISRPRPEDNEPAFTPVNQEHGAIFEAEREIPDELDNIFGDSDN